MIDRGMLEYVLNRIRPQIQADGGDLKVTKIDDDEGVVYVALQGACVDCPMSTVTMSQGVERVVVEHVPGVKHVRADMQETMIDGQSLEEAMMAEMAMSGMNGAQAGGMGMANTTAATAANAAAASGSATESDMTLPNMGGGFGGASMGGPMAGMGDDGYRDNPYLDWEDDDDDDD